MMTWATSRAHKKKIDCGHLYLSLLSYFTIVDILILYIWYGLINILWQCLIEVGASEINALVLESLIRDG